jgi:3'-phosphoadenosine 5'-phosphosulfate sulfotransferase (PAPS reductase)/FAD synthetase
MTDHGDGSDCYQERLLPVTALTRDSIRAVDNLRVQRLMAINTRQGKTTPGSIPSKSDRSAFSCAKYIFFLSAPFEIGNYCCNAIKKNPMHKYCKETGRKPITAQMASESRLRTQKWLDNGCNGFDLKEPISNPMSMWFEEDVLAYIVEHKIEIAPVYGDIVRKSDDEQLDGQMSFEDFGIFDNERPCFKTTGLNRSGCVYCGFGLHLEKRPNRLEIMDKVSSPKLRDYCLRGGAFDEEGLWKPDNRGLGMWFVLEWINRAGNFSIFIPEYERYEAEYGTDETREYLEEAKRIGEATLAARAEQKRRRKEEKQNGIGAGSKKKM